MATSIFTVQSCEPSAKKLAHPELLIDATERINPLDTRRTYGAVDLTGSFALVTPETFWRRVASLSDDNTRGNAGKLRERGESLARNIGADGIAKLAEHAGTIPAGLPATLSVILFQFDARYVVSALESIPAESRPTTATGLRDLVKSFARSHGRSGRKTGDFTNAAIVLAKQLVPALFDAYAPFPSVILTDTQTGQHVETEQLPDASNDATVIANVEPIVDNAGTTEPAPVEPEPATLPIVDTRSAKQRKRDANRSR
jgi:hypothetical protein